jgi:Protein of unknown function (DUF2762).
VTSFSEIFKLVAANGVFAVLFLFLLLYELKDSRNREQRYVSTISALTDRLGVVEDIKNEVTRLNEKLTPALDVQIKGIRSTTGEESQ